MPLGCKEGCGSKGDGSDYGGVQRAGFGCEKRHTLD